MPGLGLACFLPCLLGFVKSEWIVSYGYAMAMTLTGLALTSTAEFGLFGYLSPAGSSPLLAKLHALAYVLYGSRLFLHLLWRAGTPTFREWLDKTRAARNRPATPRLQRIPVMLGCGLLYFLMVFLPSPLLSLWLSDSLTL